MTEKVNGVELVFPDEMSLTEAKEYLRDQLNVHPGKKMKMLEIEIDCSEVLLKPHYDTVRRIRRITGYLSELPKFNNAKQAEEKARVVHGGCC